MCIRDSRRSRRGRRSWRDRRCDRAHLSRCTRPAGTQWFAQFPHCEGPRKALQVGPRRREGRQAGATVGAVLTAADR
eukprot:5592885-Alexandrium_andersonii.AAC.1